MTNQAKPSDRADGMKGESPMLKMQDRCASLPHLSHAQTQIARGRAMNPKKLGKVDKTKAPSKLALP